MSLLTFMVCLNSGYEGGATRFEAAKVTGQQGLALVFEHGLIHEGSEVMRGVKYALRSDGVDLWRLQKFAESDGSGFTGLDNNQLEQAFSRAVQAGVLQKAPIVLVARPVCRLGPLLASGGALRLH